MAAYEHRHTQIIWLLFVVSPLPDSKQLDQWDSAWGAPVGPCGVSHFLRVQEEPHGSSGLGELSERPPPASHYQTTSPCMPALAAALITTTCLRLRFHHHGVDDDERKKFRLLEQNRSCLGVPPLLRNGLPRCVRPFTLPDSMCGLRSRGTARATDASASPRRTHGHQPLDRDRATVGSSVAQASAAPADR